MTQCEAIKAALTTRGETLVKSHPKFEQWTRKYIGHRGENGKLVSSKVAPVRFWFLGHRRVNRRRFIPCCERDKG